MGFGGFGVAYDAAARALRAHQRMADRRAVRQDRRQQHTDQLLSHHLQHEREASIIDEIERQLEAPCPRRSKRICPECGEAFVVVDVNGVILDTCLNCGSFWFDKGELQALTHRAADIQTLEGAVSESRFNCPDCGARMQQHRFLLHHDLLVDKCPQDHGFYLERDELARSLDMR